MTAGHLPDSGAGDFRFWGAVWILPVVQVAL